MPTGLRGSDVAPIHEAATQTARPVWPVVVLAAVIGVNVAPLVCFSYLPTSDGPSHLYNAVLIRDWWLGEEWTERAREVVTFAPTVVPNWSGHVLLAAFTLVVEPHVAERWLMGAWVVLLPFALLYTVRSVSKSADLLALCAGPFAYSAHLHWGFYNFLTGLVLFLLAIGYWIRYRDALTRRRAITLSGMSVLTYVSSLVAFAQLLLWLGVLSALHYATPRPARARTLIATSCALAPGLVAWGLFWWHTAAEHRLAFPEFGYAALNLMAFDLLNAFHTRPARLLAGVFALVLWGTAALALRQAARTAQWDGAMFLVLAGICSVVVFTAPSAAGGGTLLTPRQVYFAVVAVVLWIGSRAPRAIVVAPLAAVATGVTLGLMVLNWQTYARYDRAMSTFLEVADRVILEDGRTLRSFPPNRRFVDLTDEGGVVLSGSAAGYLAARHRIVWLDSYEWQTDHFPLRRREANGWGERELFDAVLAWGEGRQLAHEELRSRKAHFRSEAIHDINGVYGTPVLYGAVARGQ